ncbi:MAG TPA: 2-dehydro-3-deoxy-D-gluconate 5-dehydrogenase KduD [Thermoanaerobaculaceae bacterium]|nr:2-dehydro-3-deoxy-D-gluconate 5-dehydrogenase KduD [Thermoanaerobaculaceae bacterium]HPS76621.1 2-dehydro-3-deoxy-D-gluconate 5-dehydrogenase KduD [Thermoanaerobaculaceae bacterium]
MEKNPDTLFSLAGRTAFVTGASGGLGAAIAIGLAQAGADVAVHGEARPSDCDATAAAIRAAGVRFAAVAGDLADPATPGRLVNEVMAALGGLDILVNNAGTIRRASAEDTTDEDWDHVLDVNLGSVFRLCREVGRHMLVVGHGKIINIASLLSFQGGIRVPAYAAAKSGVAAITRALANEWAGRGVNVNAIAPGYMRTANTAALRADPDRSRQILERVPAGRWGEPDDLVGAAVFLASRASDYVQGHVLVVDGGWMGR